MVKQDVLRNVAKRIDGCTIGDVSVILDTYVDVIKETLANNPEEYVALPGLGRFVVKEIPAKSGVCAFNNQKWEKPAHKELRFNPSNNVL